MAASIAKVKVSVLQSDYISIAALCQTVITGIGANPGNFPTPSPAITILTASLVTLNAAIATWGPVHNRGSHSDWVALKAAAATVYRFLIQESAYVQNVTDPSNPYATQAAFIVTSGFSVKNLPTPQGLLNAPEDFHQEFSNNVDPHTPFLQWKKPIGVSSINNVKSYEIFRSTVNTQPTVTYASVTRSRFIDTDPSIKGTQLYYWIQALNDAGLAVQLPVY